jgi:mannose-6-phosphate isomerase-like protein (cupin superfamily)
MSSHLSSVGYLTAWGVDIEHETRTNRFWRRVIYTGKHLQVVLMSVPPMEDLGWERHRDTDQFFRVDSPKATGAVLMGRKKGQVDKVVLLHDGSAAVVPAGYWHNVINTSESQPLNFYTIYSPPHHPPNRLQRTKQDEKH